MTFIRPTTAFHRSTPEILTQPVFLKLSPQKQIELTVSVSSVQLMQQRRCSESTWVHFISQKSQQSPWHVLGTFWNTEHNSSWVSALNICPCCCLCLMNRRRCSWLRTNVKSGPSGTCQALKHTKREWFPEMDHTESLSSLVPLSMAFVLSEVKWRSATANSYFHVTGSWLVSTYPQHINLDSLQCYLLLALRTSMCGCLERSGSVGLWCCIYCRFYVIKIPMLHSN